MMLVVMDRGGDPTSEEGESREKIAERRERREVRREKREERERSLECSFAPC